MNEYKLIILDKDGTLVRNRHNHDGFINSVEEQEMIPGVVKQCEELRERGIKLSIASNQGGVAFGHMKREDAIDIVTATADMIGAEHWLFSPYHPEGTDDRWKADDWYRKPRPGMLITLMYMHSVEPSEVLMVGDRPEDEEAAKRAGCDFQWAWDFFGWDPPDSWAPPDPDVGEGYLGGQDQ